MTYVWPSNDLQEPIKKIMGLLGSVWTDIYEGRDLIEGHVDVAANLAEQARDNFLEILKTNNRNTVPVFHRERWYAHTVKESTLKTLETSAWNFDDTDPLVFGNGSYDKTFDQVNIKDEYTIPFPANFSDVAIIQNAITTPTVIFTKNIDFIIDKKNKVLVFRNNPFVNAGFEKTNIFENGVVTDRELTLWFFGAQFDKKYIYEHIGHVIGLNMESSEQYRDVVNIVLDAIITGTSIDHVERLISLWADIPLVKEEVEIIEEIYTGNGYKTVVTDKHVYTFSGNATIAPKYGVGSIVSHGTSFIEEFYQIDVHQGKVTGTYSKSADWELFYAIRQARQQPLGWHNSANLTPFGGVNFTRTLSEDALDAYFQANYYHEWEGYWMGQVGQFTGLALDKSMIDPEFRNYIYFENRDVPFNVSFTPRTNATRDPWKYYDFPAAVYTSYRPPQLISDPYPGLLNYVLRRPHLDDLKILDFPIVAHPLDKELFWQKVKEKETSTNTFHSLVRAALPENIDDLNVRPKFAFRQWYDMTHPWHLSTFAWVSSFELLPPANNQNMLDRLGVNPLKFLFEHILRGNTNVFHLESAAFGPNALDIDLGELLRKIVPPEINVHIVVDLPTGSDSANMKGAATAGVPLDVTPRTMEIGIHQGGVNYLYQPTNRAGTAQWDEGDFGEMVGAEVAFALKESSYTIQ